MKKWIYIPLFFLFSTSLFAQQVEVIGKIIDSRSEPLIGVNIQTKDGKGIAVSDLEGLFKIEIPADHEFTILASYLGYKTKEVKVDGKSELTIVLEEDAKQLDEIVVVGYGTQKRSSLTSSIETISSEDLLRVPVANIDQALAGQVAGLNVMSSTGDPSSGKEASLTIRGITGTPLLVIDGVPRFGTNTTDSETRLSDLNPDDVESISVLKDAAAAAVYGSRAANGVILVTTKRGKGDRKIRINYRGQYNLQKATKLPEFLDGYEFALLYNRAVENTPGTQFAARTPNELEMIRTRSNPNEFGDENLMDYLKSNGYSTTHALSVTGGNSDITYYLSGGYTNTQGLYSGVGRDRYNYSMKLDAKLAKGLTLSVDMMGTRSANKNTSYITLDAAYNFSPIQVLRYTDGSLASIDGANPLIPLQGLGGYTRNNLNLNTLSANLKYDFASVKGLSVYLRTTFDDSNTIIKTFSNPVTLYTYDKGTKTITPDAKTMYPEAKISLSENDQNLNNKLIEAGINYDNTFAAKHNVTGMMVVNYQERKLRNLNGINENMPGAYPEIIGSGVNGKINGNEEYQERASLIGRMTYGYDYRYFFEANFRIDGSTKFHPDHRWGFFPSASASWILSNENFFKNWEQKTVSNIKFRSSIGLLGDEDIEAANYSYLMRYIFSPRQGYEFGGLSRPGIIMSSDNLPNPQIQWAKREDYNLATDLGFWNNRFGITYEYYWRYRTNMLQPVPSYLFPPSAGAGGRLPYMNFGEIKAWGWDLTFNHKNTINKVKYNVGITLSKTQDEIVDYGDESSISPFKRRKGTSSMVWWVYQAEGLFQSKDEIENYPINQDNNGNSTLAPGDIKYKDQNGDNLITSEDMIPVKNSSYPDLTFGLKLGVDYNGFFMNALFQGVSGYQKQVNDIYSLYSSSLPRFQRYHWEDTWSEENPGAKYPRIKFANTNDNNRKASTLWIKDCDFVRLKVLTFGYAMPTNIVKKLNVGSLSVSLHANNLFTISSLKDMDPESLRGYPIQRSFGASVNIGF